MFISEEKSEVPDFRGHGWLSEIKSQLGRNSTAIAGIIFVASLIFFIIFEVFATAHSEFWTDEAFALWASDPHLPFRDAFFDRILGDTNAPTYFSLLYFAQMLAGDGRTAILILNGFVGAAFFALLIWTASRKRLLPIALLAASLFILSALGLTLIPEGRVYETAMLATLNAAFLAAACLERGVSRSDIVLAAVLGVFCSWLHIYAALFCGALGISLVGAGIAGRSRDTTSLGLAMAGGAVVGLAAWIIIAYPIFSETAQHGFWLPFTLASIWGDLWGVKHYSFGWTPAALIAIVFLLMSYANPATRRLSIVFLVAMVIFIVTPLVVSLHTVIFTARYVFVGVPAFMTMLMFMVRGHLTSGGERIGLNDAAAAIGASFLLICVINGPPTAWSHFKSRWDWRGFDVVEPRIPQCAEKQIRILVLGRPEGIDYLLRGRLEPIDATTAPIRDVSDIDCTVYGWAENYAPGNDRTWVERATVEQTLAAFNLTNHQGLPLTVDRHFGGLVLRRSD
ncbi:MAG: hypothetical protein JSR99_00305 [Proteobacteria bacterium]|nr:hypothetical protein [Pseudomonadota bacterium]